ncbi:hypothetical protein D3C78_718920 [compost metagenome]
MAALGHQDRQAVVSVVPQPRHQTRPGNAEEASLGGQQVIAAGPQGRDVGRGPPGAKGPKGMFSAMQQWLIESLVATVNQLVQHPQHLPLHGRESAGGFQLDRVLVESRHDFCQWQQERRQGRGHVPDKRRRGRRHGMTEKPVVQLLDMLVDWRRRLWHAYAGEQRFQRLLVCPGVESRAAEERHGMPADALFQARQQFLGGCRWAEQLQQCL